MADEHEGVKTGEEMPVRRMTVLTLPTLGFSAAYSIVVTLLPLFLIRILGEDNPNSGLLIGFVVGGEGLFCALLPLWVGVQSDRIWTSRWGRRRPFMIYSAPFMAAALMLSPFQPGYVSIAVSTFLFFAAYHFYSSPYQSLLADVTPPTHHGRVPGYQAAMRGVGMFMGMVVSVFLYGVWEPLPFLLCGLLILVVTFLTVSRVDEPEPVVPNGRARASVWRDMGHIWRMTFKNRTMRRFMAAAFLWEGTLGAIRPFVMAYFTYTLGASANQAGTLMVVVGIMYVVAGLGGGYVADRFGRARVMRIGLWIYLGGAILAMFMDSVNWAYAALPVFGLGGAVVLTLPFGILMGIMPKENVGGFTAMFSMVRGLANVVAPLLAGWATDAARSVLVNTEYSLDRRWAAIWVVCALMIAISLFLFRGTGKEKAETAIRSAGTEVLEA